MSSEPGLVRSWWFQAYTYQKRLKGALYGEYGFAFLVEKFVAAWNAHDIDALMECMSSDDCVFYASAGSGARGDAFIGFDEVKNHTKLFSKNSPMANGIMLNILSPATGA
jgi:hypothetical protein